MEKRLRKKGVTPLVKGINHLLYPTCELLPIVKHKGKGLGFRVDM
jgi:hypothetical protein